MSTTPDYPRILTLTGASGSGKTTLIQEIFNQIPTAHYLTSVTTRPQRTSDPEGEYEYVSDQEFTTREKASRFLWTAEVHQARYGTDRLTLQAALNDEPWSVMVLVPNRLTTLHEVTGGKGILSLHLLSPGPEELRRRLLKRGDDAASVEYRIAECLDWDEQIAHSGVPVIRIPQEMPHSEIFELLKNAIPKS